MEIRDRLLFTDLPFVIPLGIPLKLILRDTDELLLMSKRKRDPA
jgi:hypothetical protein